MALCVVWATDGSVESGALVCMFMTFRLCVTAFELDLIKIMA